MSARGALQMFIVVLLALVCVGFMAVVGMSAAAAPADGGGDHGYDSTATDRPTDFDDEERRHDDGAGSTHVNVHATADTITVTNRGDRPVDVSVDALSGDYDGVREHRLDPGDSITLPAPDEPSRIRVLAESDDARIEVRLTFETYEYTCEGFAHSQVAPSSASYEFQAGGETRSRTQEFERPPFECPSPPGDGGTPTPPGDGEAPQSPEEAYNETHDRVFEQYEDGNETAWDAYEAVRQALWDGYEDGQSQFWQLYEQVMGDDDDDDDDDGGQSPPSEVNETRDFLERVGNQTQDDAERVGNDTQDNAERVANDTQGDVDRIRDDAEDGRDRVEEDVNETREELPPNDGDDDNGSDGGPTVPPEPPEDVPPEPPEDVPPEPPEDVPPQPPEDFPPEPPEDVPPEPPEDVPPQPPEDFPPEPPEDVPPEPPEDVPPEPPEDVPPQPPEDVPPQPPEDVPPGDDNESDGGDPLPEGEAASVDADADAGRDGDTIWVEGEAGIVIGDGAAYAGVDERLEVEGGSNA